MTSGMPADNDVFELTREQLDELPFGVVTLDRAGVILRYNRAEADLAARSASATVGLHFFADVAPCTDVKSFRGRFDGFARGLDSGVEVFDFAFVFRWGRHDVSITMLRKAGHDEINILVRGRVAAPVVTLPEPEPSAAAERPAQRGPIAGPEIGGACGVLTLPEPQLYTLGGIEEAALRSKVHPEDAEAVRRLVLAAAADHRPYAIEYRNVRPDGSPGVAEEIGCFGVDPDVPGWAAIVDITGRRQREEAPWRAARDDAATGLPNREYFPERAAQASHAACATGDAINHGCRRAELRAALEHGQLTLYYQPIVDIALDCVVAVEALARWNHPARGLLLPAEFIELAHETDFIVTLGEWVLREACRQAREWFAQGLRLRVCVNVSAVQFRRAEFVALVGSVLEEFSLEPGQLELELTEGVMVDGFGEMVERLSRLKALGVRLAIDDFGTGYSSLAYLKYFPVDTLKIDRAFVTDISADSFDRAIATTVLTLANELRLDCVVEGVETAEQLDTLAAIGCTLMQGYLFARPMPRRNWARHCTKRSPSHRADVDSKGSMPRPRQTPRPRLRASPQSSPDRSRSRGCRARASSAFRRRADRSRRFGRTPDSGAAPGPSHPAASRRRHR
jgi:photoactive yellow protein